MPKTSLPRNRLAQNRVSTTRTTQKTSRRQNLTYEQRIEVIDFYRSTCHYLNLREMALHLRERGFETIHPNTIGQYIKNEARIREQAASTANRLAFKHCRKVQLPEIDAALYDWLVNWVSRNGRASDYHICARAHELCKAAGIPDSDTLEFSRGWLARFKKRHGLKRIRFHGERASAPIENIKPEQLRLQSIITEYEPRNVFNIDETGLYWRMPPHYSIADYDRGGLKDDRARLTYAFCVSLDGSEKREPLVIGYAEKPQCFEGRTPSQCGYDYHNNGTAWMRADIWQKFLAALNEDMRRQNRHVLLICDNCPGHLHDPCDYSNVRVEFLAPNLTAYLQPLDAGIIAAFKAHYRREYLKFVIRRDDAGITNVYKIDQRQAMELANVAWASISAETIANCWKHTGICPPSSPEDIATECVPTVPQDPDLVRQDLLRQVGIEDGPMRLDVHPNVYRMIDVVSQDPPTEEQPTDAQLLDAARARTGQISAA